ncbi:MFS transporter [Streptomyces sp. KR80]|uniref:MFS transporter n=1 Tax=Streptomyces sp. KR80 TaxID=3457426 RepID=UPI003FD660F0
MASAVTTTRPGTTTRRPEKRPGYGQLLRTPGAWAFVLPGFAARQPFAMLTISIVLLVEHTTGSYGIAGAVAAVTGLSMALCAPQSGRLADHFGQRAVLLPGIAIHAASGGLLTALALADAPLWALFAAAVPTGASVPQIGPMVRARWAAALGSPVGELGAGSPLMSTAAAFESVTDELTFVIGPVLATALCTGAHPAAGLVAESGLTLAGGLLFAAQRGSAPPAHRRAARVDAPRASALSVPGVRVLAVAFLGIGSVFGGMQVSLTAFTQEIGQPGMNGLLYGIFAAGNMLAGVACGAIAWRTSARQRLITGYAALALACSALWAVQSPLLLGALGLLVGLCVAPALITGYTLVEAVVPPTARTEAFTWLTGSVALGQAAAVTVAGQLTDMSGAGAGFIVPLAGTALALVTVVALRGRLVARPPSRLPVARGIGHRVPVAVD